NRPRPVAPGPLAARAEGSAGGASRAALGPDHVRPGPGDRGGRLGSVVLICFVPRHLIGRSHMKLALAVLAAVALSAPPALAQETTTPPAAAEAPVSVSAEHAEHVLRQTIAQMQAGSIDYDAMVPELAEAVRAQEAGVTQML